MTYQKALSSFQKFVKIEGFSGFLLLLATLAALIWTNSPFSESYRSLWNYKAGISTTAFELNKPLILWINDGLMVVFFFLIGLEIKRELLIGELNSFKKMAFPLIGAIGGIIVPVLFFLFLNKNPEAANGWGIPMATDIAFALAVINILGNRVPLSLKIFLTAFAIVDDIGAVLVIALFYSGYIKIALLLTAFGLLLILYFLSYRGIYSKFLLVVFGIVVWVLFLKAGIHPTLAGILLAFSVPIRQEADTSEFIDNLMESVTDLKKAAVLEKPILSDEQIEKIEDIEDWINRYQSPLQHLEHQLHSWVAYLIIPLFAFANAGVSFGSSENLDYGIMSSIAIALFMGKSAGISLIVFITKKLKIIDVPNDISNIQIIGVSFLAGIGFTMAIFIAGLAFADKLDYIDSAKIGILIGSFVSAIAGYLLLFISGNKTRE